MSLVALFFLVAVVNDILVVYWHGARESGALWQIGLLTVLIGVSAWAPALWAAYSNKSVVVAVASILGQSVGSVIGTWQYRKRKMPY